MLPGPLSFRLRAASSRKDTSSCPLAGRAWFHAREGVQRIFDCPMVADGGQQDLGRRHPGQRKTASPGGHFTSHLSGSLDAAEPLEAGEFMTFIQCLSRHHNRFADLLSPMAGFLGDGHWIVFPILAKAPAGIG